MVPGIALDAFDFVSAFALIARELVVFVKILRRSGAVFDYAVVDERRAFRHGFFDCEDGRERLVLNFDEISCLACGLERLGNYSRDSVADMVHFLVQEPSVMRRRLRVALAGGHVCDIRAVVRRYDIYDSLDLLCFSSIYLVYICARIR